MQQAVRVLAEDLPIISMYTRDNVTVRDPGVSGWIDFRVDNAINVEGVSWSS